MQDNWGKIKKGVGGFMYLSFACYEQCNTFLSCLPSLNALSSSTIRCTMNTPIAEPNKTCCIPRHSVLNSSHHGFVMGIVDRKCDVRVRNTCGGDPIVCGWM